ETPPKAVPAEVTSKLAQTVDDSIVTLTPLTVAAYASFLIYAPFVIWMGVRDWTLSTVCSVAIGASVIASWAIKQLSAAGSRKLYPAFAASTIAITAAAATFGPFVMVPALAALLRDAARRTEDRSDHRGGLPPRALAVDAAGSARVSPVVRIFRGPA